MRIRDPIIRSNTSKPPSATSSTATKTIQTQFPISKKTSKLEAGLLKLLAVRAELFAKELGQKAKRKAQGWPAPKATTTKSASTTKRFNTRSLSPRANPILLPVSLDRIAVPGTSFHGGSKGKFDVQSFPYRLILIPWHLKAALVPRIL